MKKTTNHFNSSFEQQENQFLDEQYNTSRITNSHFQKDDIVHKLQQKNQKLRREVQRVKSVIQNDAINKTRYGTRLPELSKQATNQQLGNAYKQIKTYEYQIQKKRKIDSQGTFVEQVRKIEKLLKQKQQISERLKRQIFEVEKQSSQYTKMLKDDNVKNQHQAKALQLHTQIKVLREKTLQIDNKLAISNSNRTKKRQYIEKMQKQLIKEGVNQQVILNMRQKFLKNTKDNEIVKNQSKEGQTQIIQDRTPQAYQSLLNQIKLLRKLQKDHEVRIKMIEKQKQEAAEKNMKSRNELLQIEHNIQALQKQIAQMKTMINPKNLIPQRAILLERETKRLIEDGQGQQAKVKGNITHLFKFQQIGKQSRLGKRFTDRVSIGKKKAYIIGISFFEKQSHENRLIGFQALYSIQNSIKKGMLNFLQSKKMIIPNPKVFTLQSNDYFKSLECVIGEDNKIVGICLVSSKGIIVKGGCLTGTRKTIKIQPNQYPSCLFGSILQGGYIQMVGCQIIEE